MPLDGLNNHGIDMIVLYQGLIPEEPLAIAMV